jgi:hypothetical protein
MTAPGVEEERGRRKSRGIMSKRREEEKKENEKPMVLSSFLLLLILFFLLFFPVCFHSPSSFTFLGLGSARPLLEVSAATTGSGAPAPDPQFSYTGYFPSSLSVYFPHTTLITTNVTSNGGYFTYQVSSGSPTSSIVYTFNASDIYHVILSIAYPIPESGNITYQFLGPVLLPSPGGLTFQNQSQVTVSFLVELETYQAPPDAQQIAEATSGFLLSKLNAIIALMNQTEISNAQFQQSEIVNLTYGVYFALIVPTVVSVAVLLYIRKKMSPQ